MTPALKAMVEAMAAELERQADKGGSEPHFARLPGLHETHYFSGNLDLEKVARAGLEAIRAPSMELGLAGAGPVNEHMRGKVKADDFAAKDAWSTMIDAILTPTTGEGT